MHWQPGLNVGHLNAEGLRGKLPEIRLLLVETSLDILAITETKLPSNVSNEEIGIDGYSWHNGYRWHKKIEVMEVASYYTINRH